MGNTVAVNFSVLGKIYGISGKKIFRWYQDLSGYSAIKKEKQKQQRPDKIPSKTGQTLLEKSRKKTEEEMLNEMIQIWKPENFGEKMNIDEKYLSGEFYTIICNHETSKVAVAIKTIRAKWLKKCLRKLPDTTQKKVKVFSRDLSQTFKNVIDEIFPESKQVADKFHILKSGFEALSDIRNRLKQDELTKERERMESHICKEGERKSLAEKTGKKFVPKKLAPQKKLENYETKVQLLTRSRFILFKRKEERDDRQKRRAFILFDHYPELKKSYDIMEKFRDFYDNSTGKSLKYSTEILQKWLESLGDCADEMQNFASMVKRHKRYILAFFETNITNALAESINAKIQRFLQSQMKRDSFEVI